jgi:hypothetical protein
MKLSRSSLVIYGVGLLMLGGLIGANRLVEAKQAAGGPTFSVSCRAILIGEMAADQTCWLANRPAQIVNASASCDTAASNVTALQLTHDEVVALTPEAAGGGADLLGRVRATVTPTGFLLTDPPGLAVTYRPRPADASSAELTATAGNVGIFDPTAVAGGETFFKPGDRLGWDFSAVPTGAAGCVVNANFVARD